MAEQFTDGEAFSSIRGKINTAATELNQLTQALANVQSSITALTTRVTDLETNTDTPAPPPSSTLTTATFFVLDAFGYAYQNPGSSGQAWSKDTAIPSFTGTGYAQLNGISAVAGTEAIAFISGFAQDPSDPRVQADRKIWLRVYGATNQTLAVKSNQGTSGTVTITQGNTWSWVTTTTPFLAYDNTCQLLGRSANVRVDKVLLTTTANTDVPSGLEGFRNS